MDVRSFMPGEEESLEYLRMLRWPVGMRCIFCGSEMVMKTGMHGKYVRAQRYHCKACNRWFNDKSIRIFANSNLPLRAWFFATFLLQFKVSVKEIARMLGIGYKAAFFMVRKLRRSFYARRIYERLQGEMEIDEPYARAGLKGKRDLQREPRKCGLRSSGRGTYDTDKVPVVVAVRRKKQQGGDTAQPGRQGEDGDQEISTRCRPWCRSLH